MILHPWHGIDPGYNPPIIVNGIVEIPLNSIVKYEIDKVSGLIKMDRILQTDIGYPTHYGIIPQTLNVDGDPLDILILGNESLVPLTLVQCKVVGLMQMIDQGVQDDKIIAVPLKDYRYNSINDMDDIHPSILNKMKKFFETYTVKENKVVTIQGFRTKAFAYERIKKDIELYQKTFAKGF
jgi:inorganic pyrophosphatase